jgi:hypothetical protein
MIGGGGQYQSLGMETSSHGHGGSITEDFVSPNLFLTFCHDRMAADEQYAVTKGMVADVPKSALFFGTSLLTRMAFKG